MENINQLLQYQAANITAAQLQAYRSLHKIHGTRSVWFDIILKTLNLCFESGTIVCIESDGSYYSTTQPD